jgi:predicted DsbA family dithiol-disulfide isomerase
LSRTAATFDCAFARSSSTPGRRPSGSRSSTRSPGGSAAATGPHRSSPARRGSAEVGLDLRFDRAITANTFVAHRLIWFADQWDRAAEMVEVLHRAHFTDGIDIGSHSALAGLAAEVGLDSARARAFLASPAGVSDVRVQLSVAGELGITSVPTFVLAGRYAVTGAQEPETLGAVLDEVARREAAANSH